MRTILALLTLADLTGRVVATQPEIARVARLSVRALRDSLQQVEGIALVSHEVRGRRVDYLLACDRICCLTSAPGAEVGASIAARGAEVMSHTSARHAEVGCTSAPRADINAAPGAEVEPIAAPRADVASIAAPGAEVDARNRNAGAPVSARAVTNSDPGLVMVVSEQDQHHQHQKNVGVDHNRARVDATPLSARPEGMEPWVVPAVPVAPTKGWRPSTEAFAQAGNDGVDDGAGREAQIQSLVRMWQVLMGRPLNEMQADTWLNQGRPLSWVKTALRKSYLTRLDEADESKPVVIRPAYVTTVLRSLRADQVLPLGAPETSRIPGQGGPAALTGPACFAARRDPDASRTSGASEHGLALLDTAAMELS